MVIPEMCLNCGNRSSKTMSRPLLRCVFYRLRRMYSVMRAADRRNQKEEDTLLFIEEMVKVTLYGTTKPTRAAGCLCIAAGS